MARYNLKHEEFEIRDVSQSTKIIIDTLDSVPTKVYFKLRDKFSFLVGAGLSISNIEFDATDSILDVREAAVNQLYHKFPRVTSSMDLKFVRLILYLLSQ
ncbi:UNKNOWN [Stylonychia lemnae]|uniref:Uncharacterized protein n=1 Tax=Stylonychia lemnae TaxID=5949 RepID=A0A078ASJ8_STYLE|nr:UNKNOWN [Stylonychia lemnae]|eukprot:CDW84966.1 UNKNOWN [Stylonychia lemnae]